jgi:lipopolysaccharide biosynthesis glycosyltransferase
VDGKLWDDISGAPMSTEFAITRFLVPHLVRYEGWAVFMDCDMLVRTDIAKLFEEADPQYAVMCVKHVYEPPEGVKMDGQAQMRYARKNWSSVMLFNCAHPSNKALHPQYINAVPGRDLHRFAWLPDDQIGELDQAWNWLVGHSSEEINPNIVHFTEGGPWFEGYENVAYADEWLAECDKLKEKAA